MNEVPITSCVLVVDDDPTARRLLVRLLERHGYSTRTAENGWQAIAALRKTRFAMVFMDCEMPLLDGLRATEQLRRSDGDNAEAFVVAVTAHDDDRIRKACRDAGMDAFLSKPVTMPSLRSILDAYRQHPRQRRSA